MGFGGDMGRKEGETSSEERGGKRHLEARRLASQGEEIRSQSLTNLGSLLPCSKIQRPDRDMNTVGEKKP